MNTRRKKTKAQFPSSIRPSLPPPPPPRSQDGIVLYRSIVAEELAPRACRERPYANGR